MQINRLAPSLHPSFVCVTGASGFVGAHIVRSCLKRGYHVRAVVSPKDDDGFLMSLSDAEQRLEIARFDLKRDGSLDSVVKGCRFVFHVPFIVDEGGFPNLVQSTGHLTADLYRAVEESQNVIKSCSRAVWLGKKIEKVVLVSSALTMVHGRSKFLFGEEDWNAKYTSQGDPFTYTLVRLEKEAYRIVHELPPDESVQLVTVHPFVTIGPLLSRRHRSVSMISLLRRIMDVEMTRVPAMCFGLVDVRDVATACVFLAENQHCSGRYMCSAESMWLEDIIQFLRLRYPERKIPNPRVMFNLEVVLFSLARHSTSLKAIREHLDIPRFGNSQKLIEELRFKFREVRHSLCDCVNSLVSSDGGAGVAIEPSPSPAPLTARSAVLSSTITIQLPHEARASSAAPRMQSNAQQQSPSAPTHEKPTSPPSTTALASPEPESIVVELPWESSRKSTKSVQRNRSVDRVEKNEYVVTERHFDMLLDMEKSHDASWEQVTSRPTFKLWKKQIPNSNFYSFKAIVIIDLHRDDVLETLWDCKWRKTWDSNCLEIKTVQEYALNNECCYFRAKCPPGISHRYFCHYRARKKGRSKSDPHLLFFHSGPHPKCPVKKNDVLATSSGNGVVLRHFEENGQPKTEMMSIFHDNFGGSVPPWAANWITAKFAPTVFKDLINACKNYGLYKEGKYKRK